ncbi:MAG TPA: glycosyltransferase [Burkholderiales bacterium]|nr:glycosyltransferase [Burkholderiales bacterium]HEX2650489.1 glycosyltransferase [Burkholderiales bacterium]
MSHVFSRSDPKAFVASGVRDLWDALLIVAIFAGLGVLAWMALGTTLLRPLLEMAEREQWSSLWVRPTVIWVAMGLVLLLLRTLLWLFYRPRAAASMEDAPALSVIIPAYNEGEMVARSIESVALARYPAGRLEILAIDDGSKDGGATWRHIEAAARRFPALVTAIRLAENRGKRGALAEGFRRARGEIFLTVDSDSVIERDALLAAAGPFRDPKIGAVAGKVVVYNRAQGLIPRMLHVRFVLSFDFLRSAQSMFRTVYCCPGAFAVYRAEVVRRVLASWEGQTFFGVPCTYGEDRALTNEILRAGYDTVYQRTAVVRTIVPTTYKQLCRMYLRWDRSYIREEMRFSRIVWRRPLGSRLLALYESGITNLRYPIAYSAMALWFVNGLSDPASLLRMLVAIMAVSTVYTLYYLRSERSWDFVFGILYGYFAFFALSWIFLYAAATLRARGWLTR